MDHFWKILNDACGICGFWSCRCLRVGAVEHEARR